jgi:hypothetical protein
MYISEIDDILDQTLDKFMYSWIIENQIKDILSWSKLVKEPNFIKYQKDINIIIEYGQDLISDKVIGKIVSKNSNIILIKNLISKYIGYYLFLLIGINYNGKIEIFNNNLIEFSRAQSNYKLKIDNFFNTESNSNIIKITNLIKEFVDYIEKLSNGKTKDNIKIDNYSSNLKEFLNDFGEDNINNFVNLYKKEITKNKIILDHNIIKIMIYLNLYKTSEKKEIFNIIETTETSNGEFIFIDVVVPKSSFIDYNSIENVLEPHELKTNLPETIYDIINEDYSENINDARKYFTDFDLKIQKLLDTHIIVPIVDDFLLYHKDNEKYEKQGDRAESVKKKDETKIKYIVNKINTVCDYYKNPSEIKKLFYVPLQDRNAVLTNTYEDIKIISKMKNIIKMNNENLDLLNDLINYKLYPYISFKDFKSNGFVFGSETTLDGIRNVSIGDIGKKKFNVLQTRIVSENMLVNIVGFAIINTSDPIDCVDTNTFVNISDQTDNPLQVIKVLLENKIKKINFPNSKNIDNLEKNYYWLFDLNKQKYSVPYYDISPNMNKNDVVKILSAYLYDWIMECIINFIKDDINTTHPKFITDYINSFNACTHKFPDINNQQYSKNINELEYLMYYIKSKKVTDTYDYKEDEFPGLYGNVIKLPVIPDKPKPPIPVIKIKTDFKSLSDNTVGTQIKKLSQKELEKDIDPGTIEYETNEYLKGICQHNISWDKIAELKKQNDVKYSDLVYEFIQQYVDVSPTQDFICKSCKSSINIKKYILDGQFDNNTQSFVTFSVQLDVPLEEMPEYEKYKTSIRSLDKIIDRVCSIINFQGLFGSNYTSRSKRKNVVKDTLDLVLTHNNYLKKAYYLTNRDKYTQQFGINKNISNLYVFELENNIFVYSSKDKDFYKFLKYNNVISYILILLLLEINDTQIQSLANDKNVCSYFIYKKIGYTLFENINIIVNKSHDTKPIKNYPVLCYLIYIMSCFISKYNLWADTLSTESNIIDKKKNFLVIQKSIINTIVEIFNTILQVNVDELKSKKIYLDEIFQTKYYYKIDLFKDFNLIRKLDKMYLSDGTAKQQKQYQIDSNKFDIESNYDVFNQYVVDNLYDRFSKKYCLKRLVCPFYTKDFVKITKISNLSNCIGGEFHDFKSSGKNLVCVRCKEIANPENFIPDSEKVIGERYNILYLRKLAGKYCQTGLIHQFEYNSKQDQNICTNCGYVKGSMIKYTDKELYNLFDIIEENIKTNNLKVQKLVNSIQNISSKEISDISKLFNKIVYKYEKYNNNISKSIDLLLDSMQKLLGIDIIVGNETYNLYHNIYIIDHDYNGTKLEKPIMIYEKDNKFRIIESHGHFKRSVLVYTMQKNTKYELFYDLEEKILLGYREINKEYIDVKKITVKLKINYSFKNILMLFGLTRQQINIRDFYPELYGLSKEKIDHIYSDFNMENFINKIASRRFDIIKKLGTELKKYINRFKNNYKINIITIEATFSNNQNQQITNTYISESANNPLDLLYVKYQKKIENNIIIEVEKPNGKSNKNNKKDKKDKKSEDKDNLTDTNNSGNTEESLHVFLKYINIINMYLPFENIKLSKNDIPKFSESIDYNVIFKNDYIGNITLNYIIDEIIRLINYNNNKNTKTNIIHFIADIICTIFNSTFFEISKFNPQLNYFYQILYTSEFYLETQTNEFMMDALDYYSNQEEIKNIDNLDDEQREQLEDQIENDNEEYQAIDAEDEIVDAEGMYDLYTVYDLDKIKKPDIIV